MKYSKEQIQRSSETLVRWMNEIGNNPILITRVCRGRGKSNRDGYVFHAPFFQKELTTGKPSMAFTELTLTIAFLTGKTLTRNDEAIMTNNPEELIRMAKRVAGISDNMFNTWRLYP